MDRTRQKHHRSGVPSSSRPGKTGDPLWFLRVRGRPGLREDLFPHFVTAWYKGLVQMSPPPGSAPDSLFSAPIHQHSFPHIAHIPPYCTFLQSPSPSLESLRAVTFISLPPAPSPVESSSCQCPRNHSSCCRGCCLGKGMGGTSPGGLTWAPRLPAQPPTHGRTQASRLTRCRILTNTPRDDG